MGLKGLLAVGLLAVASPVAAQVELYGFQHVALTTALDATGVNVPGRRADEQTAVDVTTQKDVRFGFAVGVEVTDTLAVEFMWLRHRLAGTFGTGPSTTHVPLDLQVTQYMGHVLYRLRRVFVFAGVGRAVNRSQAPPAVTEGHWTYDGGVGTTMTLPLDRLDLRVQARLAPMPAADQTRSVQGRGGAGTYGIHASANAVAVELMVGVTTRF